MSMEIGLGLTLPLEAVTETFVILAKRGSGKTYTAAVLVEEMLDGGQPVVVLDPVGAWWGLRSNAAGDGPGQSVVIFGGDHADLPLEETAGQLLADVIVDERIPAVLDLSVLSKSASRRFVADFLERLYHRNRDPLHVVVDEADAFAPQRVDPGQQRLLGAMEDLVRRGRQRGLGVTLITQRPAVLNKDVLTQAEVLIALRMTGVRDVAAIDEWVRLHADEDQAAEVKRSLPSLPVGTAWVWSPGWLGILERVEVRRRRTFDSSATPKPGQRRIEPKRKADVDLDALGERITATVERAKADDPKQLRKRIADLERDLATAGDREPERVEVPVPVLDEELVVRLEEVLQGLREHGQQAIDIAQDTLDQLYRARGQGRVDRPVPAAPRTERPSASRAAPVVPPRPRDANGTLPVAQRKILTVLAQQGTRSTQQVALLTGYSAKSGGFRNALSALRTSGYIDGRGEVTATEDGLLALGEFERLPTGRALVEWWKSQLGKAERTILEELVQAWPSVVPVPVLADRTEYSATSGGFRNALSRLRTLGLAEGRGELRVANELGQA